MAWIFSALGALLSAGKFIWGLLHKSPDPVRQGMAEQAQADQARGLDEISQAQSARNDADARALRDPSSLRANDPFSRD